LGVNRDEERLIEALKKREEWAYSWLYDRYAPMVAGIAKSYLGIDDIDDVIQEVFVRVYKGIKKFRGDSSLSTWIYRIAVNVCKDIMGKYKRNKEVLTDFDSEEAPYLEPRSEGGPVENMISELTIEALENAMNQLSEEDRLLIKLRDIEGLSYDEIAKIINKPVGTVKSRLHYARKRLGELIKNLV
jgi:RNA polymerase sigma-70 factor (ECF subfamily)